MPRQGLCNCSKKQLQNPRGKAWSSLLTSCPCPRPRICSRRDIKVLNKTIKSLMSKVDDQLVHKKAIKKDWWYHQQWSNEPGTQQRFCHVPRSLREEGEQGCQSCSCFPAKRDQEEGRSVQPWICCQHAAQHVQP
jgi:hypothetical protein